MDAEQTHRRPGDLILNRYMPKATTEEREAARANLSALLATLIRIEERREREGSGQRDSPNEEPHARVENDTSSK